MKRSIRLFAFSGLALALVLSPGAFAARTVTLLDSWDITEWDPSVYYGPEPRVILNIYETLAFYNPESGVAEPKLASSWSVSDDGLTWTFNLREGVTFHDGSEWNAAAAKANIDRIRELGQGAAYIWASVTDVEAPASHTLVVTNRVSDPSRSRGHLAVCGSDGCAICAGEGDRVVRAGQRGRDGTLPARAMGEVTADRAREVRTITGAAGPERSSSGSSTERFPRSRLRCRCCAAVKAT